jgi:hypothetical protein
MRPCFSAAPTGMAQEAVEGVWVVWVARRRCGGGAGCGERVLHSGRRKGVGVASGLRLGLFAAGEFVLSHPFRKKTRKGWGTGRFVSKRRVRALLY